jgi:hypothetical protein
MTDRYKGFIVHLDKDLRDDDCEEIIIALKNIKHVANVKPLISTDKDDIAYDRGRREIISKIYEILKNEILKNER